MTRIELNLKPSWYLFILLLMLHLLAITAAACSDVFVFYKILLTVFVLISGYYFCWQNALHQGHKVIKKCYFIDEQWILFDKKGRQYQAELSESFVSVYLAALNFRLIDKGKRKTVLIFPDSLDKQTFRKLRVELLSFVKI